GGAQGEDRAVVAEEGDDAAGAEHGRGGDVVAGDGQSVAERGEGAVAGVELVEVVAVGAGHHAQQQGDGGDGGEPDEGHGLGVSAESGVHRVSPRRASSSACLRMRSARGSTRRRAVRSYRTMASQVTGTWTRASSSPAGRPSVTVDAMKEGANADRTRKRTK